MKKLPSSLSQYYKKHYFKYELNMRNFYKNSQYKFRPSKIRKSQKFSNNGKLKNKEE